MSGRSSPTVRRRRLGMDLRQLRETSGMTAGEAAERLGWYAAKVSRIETARITVHWGDVVELLDLYELESTADRDALIQLAKEARKRDWWQPYSDVLSKNLAAYIGLESAAEVLRIYQPIVIPGLLQTEDYARAVLRDGSVLELKEDELERRVVLRMERQKAVSENDSLRLWFILHEAVLHSGVGGKATMADQLRRLRKESSSPRLTIQVVPVNAGAHPGSAGAFGVFEFPGDDRDVAYTDTVAGVLYLERKADVKATSLAFDHLSAVALSPADSIDLITAATTRYESSGSGIHDAGLQPLHLDKELPKR